LERNAAPSGGATGRNGGLHIPGAADGYADSADRLGRAAVRAIAQATDTNRQLLEALLEREGLDVGYRRTGFFALAGADEADQVRRSATLLREDGFAAEWLDRADAEAAWGTRLGALFAGAMFNAHGASLH